MNVIAGFNKPATISLKVRLRMSHAVCFNIRGLNRSGSYETSLKM